MTDIAFPGARVKSIYDYVDVLQVWLAEPLSPSEMSLCPSALCLCLAGQRFPDQGARTVELPVPAVLARLPAR